MESRIIIKAILFDFHGVLVFRKKDYRPDSVADGIDSMIGDCANDAEFKARAMGKYGLNEKEFQSVLDRIVDKYEKFAELWELLPQLRKKYKLAIINNGTFLTVPKFDAKFSICGSFDLFVSSAAEGVRKPDAKIFLPTAQKLGVVPEECLFMDDMKINIKGAAAVGMETIWWENKETGFEKFLETIGVDKLL